MACEQGRLYRDPRPWRDDPVGRRPDEQGSIMAFWGADTDAVIEHGRRCRSDEQRIAELAERLSGLVGAVEWTGPDADAFRDRWQGVRTGLEDVAGDLGSTAEFLGLQAAQQDSASDPDGSLDASRYDGLVGGSFGWSDIINGVEQVSDLWRDKVTTESMGGSWQSTHPQWKPEDVPLDVDSIRNAQMQQGQLGDCWFLAALMAAQKTDPKQLADNIKPQGQPPGSAGWTVRLFVDGAWKDVSVSPDQIANQGAKSAARNGGYHDAGIGFMSIYEQAMINECGGSPSGVSADTPAKGLEMITGRPAAETDTVAQPSFDQYKAAIDAGRPVTVMTDPIKPLGDGGQLVNAHVYQVSGYDEKTGEIILTNPHGPHASSQYTVRVKPGDPGFYTSIFMTGVGEKP